MDERLRTNRINWNERTPIHAASRFYDVAGFKAGRVALTELERREVGDVSGKTLLGRNRNRANNGGAANRIPA